MLFCLPKVHGPLTIRMHCNWPLLNMQLMVSEAWLVTICHWTHGCDINVVKNYLNWKLNYHLHLKDGVRYCFQFVSSHLNLGGSHPANGEGRGYPMLPVGGYPHPFQQGSTPILPSGGTPIQSWLGYPIWPMEGTPSGWQQGVPWGTTHQD